MKSPSCTVFVAFLLNAGALLCLLIAGLGVPFYFMLMAVWFHILVPDLLLGCFMAVAVLVTGAYGLRKAAKVVEGDLESDDLVIHK